jgi:hypothetical protein
MRLEMNAEYDGELGARIQDVARQALEAAAGTYAHDPDIDVEDHVRMQLSSRGIKRADEAWVAEAARSIRSGHHATVVEPDGSIDSP